MPQLPLHPTPHAPRTAEPAPSAPVAWSARRTRPDRVQRTVAGVVDEVRRNGPGVLVLPVVVLAAMFVAGTAPGSPATQVAPTVGTAQALAPEDGPVTMAAAAPAPQAEAPGEPVRFASYEDLELFLPSSRAFISGFHEASYPHALRMRPWGTPMANDNLRKDAVAPVADGPNYAIMSSRGRATHATSAVDVALPHHAPVASPVTGTVVEVTPYALYGRYADTRIRIRPADRPDLVLSVLHVSDPAVRVGDEVVGGRTQLAGRATAFPFRSHVDDYAGGRPPHVHLELKRG